MVTAAATKCLINAEHRECFNHLFTVSLNNHDPFTYQVYANHAQHALDQVVNYLQEMNDISYFVDLVEDTITEDDVIVGGDQGKYLLIEHTIINELSR